MQRLVTLLSLITLASQSAMGASRPSASTPVVQADAFDRLGALAGEWDASLPGFGTVTTSIHWVSNGRALEEVTGTPSDSEVSIYTRQGKKIVITHFCAMTPDGHIVRMSTGELSGSQSQLEFSFVGSSNLHTPSAPHMEHLLTMFTDHNHFTERWTKTEDGNTTTFDLKFVRR